MSEIVRESFLRPQNAYVCTSYMTTNIQEKETLCCVVKQGWLVAGKTHPHLNHAEINAGQIHSQQMNRHRRWRYM